ncbi:TlpA disulfide reductase family protein [Chitinophaga eiseniae]|uniref:TlpA family protein disulfide reductase n=1 Tax=Chitinophaga eiseniae TaxID=634771 RepID=A0A847SH76_9BACT|nr:TlpA disulfide reductase family protein [Chitinophaga eiseniae]NLR81181.1 TlpA family protein disulfide reductase [Chitinophaga eiseniae]
MDTSLQALNKAFFSERNPDKKIVILEQIKQYPAHGNTEILQGDIAREYAAAGNLDKSIHWLSGITSPDGHLYVAENIAGILHQQGNPAYAIKLLQPEADSISRLFLKNKNDKQVLTIYGKLLSVLGKALYANRQPDKVVACLRPLYAVSGKFFPIDAEDKIVINITRGHYDFRTDNLTYTYACALEATGNKKEALKVLTNLELAGVEQDTLLRSDIDRLCVTVPKGRALYRQWRNEAIGENFRLVKMLAASKKQPNGETITPGAWQGKYLLIDFWGSWCHPCRASHPHLKELYEKYHSKGLVIIGVANETGKDIAQQRKTWLQAIAQDQLPWYQLLNNEQQTQFDAVTAFRVNAFPTKILLDKDGNIVGRYTGNGDGSNELTAQLEQVFR